MSIMSAIISTYLTLAIAKTLARFMDMMWMLRDLEGFKKYSTKTKVRLIIMLARYSIIVGAIWPVGLWIRFCEEL